MASLHIQNWAGTLEIFHFKQNFSLFRPQSCENLLVYLRCSEPAQGEVGGGCWSSYLIFYHLMRWNAWENCGTQTHQSGNEKLVVTFSNHLQYPFFHWFRKLHQNKLTKSLIPSEQPLARSHQSCWCLGSSRSSWRCTWRQNKFDSWKPSSKHVALLK